MQMIFFVPGSENTLGEFVNGADVCCVTGRTLDELKASNPAGVLGTVDEFYRAQASEPVEISRDAFIDALECLPPQGWIRAGDSESFKFLEHWSGPITTIYVRIGADYWKFLAHYKLTHYEVLQHVRAHQKRSVIAVQVIAEDGAEAAFSVALGEAGPVCGVARWNRETLAATAEVVITPTIDGRTKQAETISGDAWRSIEQAGETGALWRALFLGASVESAARLITTAH